jgi:hypothetical protein
MKRKRDLDDVHKTSLYVKLGDYMQLITHLRRRETNFTKWLNLKITEQLKEWNSEIQTSVSDGASEN